MNYNEKKTISLKLKLEKESGVCIRKRKAKLIYKRRHNMSSLKKVALVTGASSGIGEETAIVLSQRGFTVYGAARRLDRLKSLEAKGIKTVSLDVTNEASMTSCVESIIKEEGRIDVLVNNAGYGTFGTVEEVPMEEGRRQIEVNIMGLAKMTQLVLPYMRENKYGKIVNIASMGGRVWTPFGAWYHMTKFAVEGFSACLRLEVEPFGIDVIVIEPGGIKTNWGIIAADGLEKASGKGPYKDEVNIVSDVMRENYTTGKKFTPPLAVAECIGKAVTANRPKTRYLIGYGSKSGVLVQKLLGDRIYDKIIKKMYKL